MTMEQRMDQLEKRNKQPDGGIDDDRCGGDYYPVLRLWR